jgi:hypothetical protein
MIVAFAFGVIVYTKEYNFDFLNAYLQELAYSFEKLFYNFLKNIIRQLFAGESHYVVKITKPYCSLKRIYSGMTSFLIR